MARSGTLAHILGLPLQLRIIRGEPEVVVLGSALSPVLLKKGALWSGHGHTGDRQMSWSATEHKHLLFQEVNRRPSPAGRHLFEAMNQL